MAVPDARVELQIGGVWTDTEDDLLHGEGIRYSWGRRAEGARTDPAAAAFSLRDPTGKYSSRNPMSPYYGQLGRNTPVRLSHGGADVALVVASGAAGRATTPDAAALDITGDIDVRADLTPSAWEGDHFNVAWEVMSKYDTASQRSWMLFVYNLGLSFRWSTDGVSFVTTQATALLPFSPGRRGAVRATLDVNNGAGGWTVTFYTAATLAGSWTQLGDPVTGVGVTSIFNSTAALEVGDLPSLAFATVAREYHAIEVRNGIGGTAVANPNFAAQADGTTGFTDAAGRTWSVAGDAAVTSRRIRAVLEASEWSPRWGASGHDVKVPVSAAGVLRRLGQGAKALDSPLRRRLPTRGPVAYWPMEDGREATQAYSPLPGCPPMYVYAMNFGSDDTCPGSAALPAIGSGAIMAGSVPAYTSPTSGYTIAMVYQVDSMPASKSTWLSIQTTGTAVDMVMSFTNTTVVCDLYNSSGSLITSQSFSNASAFGPDKWLRFDCTAQANGGNTDFHLGFVTIDGGGVQWNFSIAGTPGIVTLVDTWFGSLLEGMRVGHVAVFPTSDTTVWGTADNGYRGEEAGARIQRLCTEESVPVVVAAPGLSTALGAQSPSTLLDLLGEAEAADDGILSEDPQYPGLFYRSRDTLLSQTPKATIPYGQLAPPLEPTDDDRWLRNDRTVSRTGGSSGRAVLTSGTLSTAAPPLGVGAYSDSQTLSLYQDSQVQNMADWLLHRGTWDEARYPSVTIYLHKYPALVPTVSALRPGDIIRITDLPAWLPPGPLDLMVEGAQETFKSFEWTITLSCSPAGPWTVAVADDPLLGRADTDGSQLASGVTSTATSLSVAVTAGPLWTTSGSEVPFDIEIGGEVITVGGISGASSPQTFSPVTRSVNGIVKSHLSGAVVVLAQPAIAAP